MDWRQPADDFGRRLEAARERAVTNLTDPWRAVELFEPILEALNNNPPPREEKLARLRSLGRDLFTELRAGGSPISMEVRHYCWRLKHIGDPGGSPASSVKDMRMTTLTRFARYERHETDRCFLCDEFRGDLPFQGSPGGRAYFHEWLKRRQGDAEE